MSKSRFFLPGRGKHAKRGAPGVAGDKLAKRFAKIYRPRGY